jgi:GNAT superfamily N-acetyltransferase
MTSDTLHASGGFHLREFRVEDLVAVTYVLNATYPDEPTTLEEQEHWERVYPADNPRLRLAVETEAGKFVGFGQCMKPYWLDAPGVYTAYAVVAPPWRRRGIGQALLARLEPFAVAQGALRIHAPDCREDFAGTSRFLDRAGYINIGVRFEQKLDLEAFDETPFAGVFQRVAEGGYALTTLAAERAVRVDADEALFAVADSVSPEVPLPGDVHIRLTYNDFVQSTLEGPSTDPAAIFVAKQGETYVGMTAVSVPQDGPAITNATYVLPAHRRRGLALALKLLSFRFLRARGYTEARTHNDTVNPPILRLNERLGYQRLPGWLVWEKRLT